MNHFNGFARETNCGRGYYAMVRTASDAQAKPIVGKGGKPRLFATEVEALREVILHLTRYINGHLVRDGAIVGRDREAAEALFPKLLKQKGKTRIIQVETKRRRA